MKKSLILTGGFLLLTAGLFAETLPYQDPNLSPEERAADLVSRMTLEQKIDQVGHKTSAIPSLGLKGYNYWNEAIHGVARSGLATSFPVSKALSSTWDLPLIFDVASAISDECRIYNNNSGKGLIYWCPTINMSRDPRWGRDEENYGEDPFLTGRIAVEFIKGMQGDDDKYYKTIATAKHFAANNYERGRHNTSSNVDDRNLREYYLPAFEMAVKEANVRSIMSAYNAVNGVPCGANHELLIDILRGEWGFDGFVTSDCGAVEDVYNKHHYVKTGAEASAVSMVNGEDLNCGDTFQVYCKEAIEKGLMTEADLDLALTRVLAARFSVGEFDPASSVRWTGVSSDLLNCEAHQQLALKAAQEAIVLLKNDNSFLPLSKEKSVAIIGPQGNNVILGGYSGSPTALTTVLEGVASKLDYLYDDGTVQFEDCDEQSIESGSKRLTHEANGSSGNLGYIFNNDWVAFENVHFGAGRTHLDIYHGAKNNNATVVKFYLDNMDGDPVATVTCPVTGNWSKYVVTTVEVDPAVFNGTHKVYTKFEGGTNGDKYCANMDWFRFYDPNVTNPLEEEGPVYYYKGCDITGTASTDIERAKEIAAKADVVIFCGGTDLSVSDESNDRTSLNLPGDQQKLLEAVYTVNPNIVLVLQTCSSMTVNWAQEHVPAIVEAWYDGQAQGQAIADVLYGDFNPSGHLTSTWYNSLSDLPSNLLNYDIRNAGYTYMYHKGTPLYPFGHGLSYTEFEYADMTLSSDHLNKDEEITVSTTIKNVGDRAGADVVQLYARCESEIDRPQMQLIGFARVELEPGESKTVTIPLKHEQLCYFNTETQTFDVEGGTVDLMLAESATEVRLKTSLTTQEGTVKLTYKSDPSSVKGIMDETNGIYQSGYFDLTGRYLGNSLERLAPGYYVTKGKVVRK
ncbi:MAG: glycoside hydrolase family 3 C-terminal domain-containing protein [Muribaculaceae bacterium]|nr:glycoside hydrolase family 3 C-terminal domain-containing protein [Muribaculaceae bacterium]MDE6551738.1 glycoside hydrolase family 3 C-terminal domain-containing protein [Muribaculaceae bacterium]